MIEDRAGWIDMPAAEKWRCPDCSGVFLVDDWQECEPWCEDCGSHDGRECPGCKHWFDCVWGVKRLAEAQVEPKHTL